MNSGFEDNYVSFPSVSSFVTCPICFLIPYRPVSIKFCGHVFCDSCIEGIRRTSAGSAISTCPTCRQLFVFSEVIEFSRWDALSKRFFTSLEVKCPRECGFSGNPFKAKIHIDHECPKRDNIRPALIRQNATVGLPRRPQPTVVTGSVDDLIVPDLEALNDDVDRVFGSSHSN